MDERPTTQVPAKTRSSLILETAAEMIRPTGFSMNQSLVQMRRQGKEDWGLALFGSDSYRVINQVAAREVDVALMNPAGPLAAGYRGKGPFSEPVPVRAITVIPSLDWMVFAVANRTGLGSLAEVKERRYPLRISLRAQPDHATHLYVNEVLKCYGFSVEDVISWGGAIVPDSEMSYRPTRTAKVTSGEVDAIFDEAVLQLIPQLDELEMHLLPLEEPVLQAMDDIGFHRSPITKAMFPNLPADIPALDFSGWPVYTHADVPDELIYRFCQALDARKSNIVWQEPRDLPLAEMCRDSQAGPLKIPLHPAAERYWREAGYLS
ncbi:MAG: hypothetical protein HW416_96 [Chloroflexi bacterium]|nr:hypothetical protein [Chloroflexota bacterium]